MNYNTAAHVSMEIHTKCAKCNIHLVWKWESGDLEKAGCLLSLLNSSRCWGSSWAWKEFRWLQNCLGAGRRSFSWCARVVNSVWFQFVFKVVCALAGILNFSDWVILYVPRTLNDLHGVWFVTLLSRSCSRLIYTVCGLSLCFQGRVRAWIGRWFIYCVPIQTILSIPWLANTIFDIDCTSILTISCWHWRPGIRKSFWSKWSGRRWTGLQNWLSEKIYRYLASGYLAPSSWLWWCMIYKLVFNCMSVLASHVLMNCLLPFSLIGDIGNDGNDNNLDFKYH